jgi:hypothetical protein
MRYFLLKDENTLEVYLSQELEVQPDNSIPFQVCDWKRAKFDIYPNPTKIEELIVKETIEIPSEVALWKIRAIIKGLNLEEKIKQSFELLEEPNRTGAKYIWEYGTLIERYSNTVLFIQEVLELTNEQVDNIFINANNIKL